MGIPSKGPLLVDPYFMGTQRNPSTKSLTILETSIGSKRKRANAAFDMMDGKQRKLALLGDSRGENGPKTIELTGKKNGLDPNV